MIAPPAGDPTRAKEACAEAIDEATLVEHWLGELDDAAEAGLDEHVLDCAACSARLAQIGDYTFNHTAGEAS